MSKRQPSMVATAHHTAKPGMWLANLPLCSRPLFPTRRLHEGIIWAGILMATHERLVSAEMPMLSIRF
jgi:hypothetical protein